MMTLARGRPRGHGCGSTMPSKPSGHRRFRPARLTLSAKRGYAAFSTIGLDCLSRHFSILQPGLMSTVIPIHRLDEAKSAVEACSHLGFCTAVCPTYELDGEENDSPRGRIALAKKLFDSGAAASAETILHLDRCLSCLSCQTTCGANVNYRDIIDAAREHIEVSGARPWRQRLFRGFLAQVLTNPRLLAPMLSVGRVLAPMGHRFPGSLGALAQLSIAPAARALSRSGVSDAHRNSGRTNGSSRGAGIDTGMETSGGRCVILLSGCVQDVVGAEINAAAERILKRARLKVIATSGGTCCGALDLHLGRRQQAVQHAARLVNEWAEQLAANEVIAIVTTASGCASVLQHCDEVLSELPQMAAAIAAVKSSLKDITELVPSLDLPTADSVTGLRVAYHDACSMKHGLKLTSTPRNAMRKLGIEVIDIAESHLCCGSAGTYNILQPEIAERLGLRKASHAGASHPDVIAAGNLGCLVQISRFTDIPIVHTVQLLDWATGGPAPVGLQGFLPQPVPKAVPEETYLPGALAPNSEDTFW
jgi:glycolate oxidase iron-sulfur subunit